MITAPPSEHLMLHAAQKGQRATRAEMTARYDAITAIAAEVHPATVRQIFYQCVVRGVMDKSESGYEKVQRAVQALRERGRIPYEWIVDSSRTAYRASTYDTPDLALKELARQLRLNIWRSSSYRVEFWLEKRALFGVVAKAALTWQCPLYIPVGFSSDTYLHEAACSIAESDCETHVFFLTDDDPSGLKIEKTIRRKLPKFIERAGGNPRRCFFERLGLTVEQIEKYELPSRPTKTSSHSKGFDRDSTELDALRPAVLRDLVEDTILRFVDYDEVRRIKNEEALAREGLRALDYSRLVGAN